MAKMKSSIAILPAILAGAVLLSAAFRAPSAEAVVINYRSIGTNNAELFNTGTALVVSAFFPRESVTVSRTV